MEGYIDGNRISRAEELYEERLQQARQRRLLHNANRERITRASLYGRMMLWLGTRLVAFGKKMQRQYS